MKRQTDTPARAVFAELRVAEPGVVAADADQGQDRVQRAAVLEEVEEDEADRHAVDEVGGEEQDALEQVAQPQVEAEDRGEVERGGDLHHGRGQVVEADGEHPEQLGGG